MEEILFDLALAFIGGGILAVIAQLLIDLTKLTPERILVCYVCVGVLIYAVGLYEPLYSLFGCGVSVPLIGFGAGIGKGVSEAIAREGALGILTGGMSAASAGITLSLFLGLCASLIFKPKPKKM